MEDDYDRRQNHSEEEIPVRIAKELPVTFGGFTIRESWDIFFSSRGSHDFSEWYADWPQLQTLLVNQLLFPSWNPPHPPADVRILVPACGNSRLSEHLYDDGFTNITNVDFSKVKIVVIGLGSGVLPMFMRNCLPSLQIEVVEIDPVVLNVAREYFGFREDEYFNTWYTFHVVIALCHARRTLRLTVHIADAMKFVHDKATSKAGKDSFKIDVLIVDVDSSDSSSGLLCPDADFVEESFFLTAKESRRGIFTFNVISRFTSVRGAIYSRLKQVFSNLFHLWIQEDFNEVIFALKSDSPIDKDQLSEACDSLAMSLQHKNQHRFRRVVTYLKLIKPLK